MNWSHVRIPGATCGVKPSLQLNHGTAVVPYPGGTVDGDKVVVDMDPKVRYANLNGAGQDEAALGVDCATTAGTADGQIESSWVIFSVDSGVLKVLGTLEPQQSAAAQKVAEHSPYYDGEPKFGSATITFKELWYTADDATCCPSITATTVWRYKNNALTVESVRH